MALWSSTRDYLPVSSSPDSRSRFPKFRVARNGPASFTLLALALITGLFGGYLLAAPPSKPELCTFPFDLPDHHSLPEIPPLQNDSQPAHPPEPLVPSEPSVELPLIGEDPDIEDLRTLVAGSRGFYARDYSMGLGWNNMRYIIETALYHGSLLNRTVVLPSYIYARSCEFENEVCAAHAQMVNRGDALGSDEWRQLPEEQQMGWKIPISVMLNFTHLRRSQPVVTVAEYLCLHDLSPDFELSNGQWDAQKYHQMPSVHDSQVVKPPSLHVVQNGWYDPLGLNRVDILPEKMKTRGQWDSRLGDTAKDQLSGWPSPSKTDTYLALERELSGRQYVLGFEKAREILQNNGIRDVDSDEGLIQILNENGWEVLYTFDGALGMDYVKNVVNPIKQVAPRHSIRGFVDDYYHFTEDVLLVRGEIHYERKPASLRFTSTSARDAFARLVLFQMRHTDRVMELSATMAQRMQALVDGRMWMAAHMRRGDFVRYNWAMQADFGEHLQRIKNHLDKGRDILNSITPQSLGTYAVPDIATNPEYIERRPPNKYDLIYIATDERDPINLAYLREHGVIRAADLITIEDRRRFGWSLLVTDVLGIVEQDLLARASFFYAHALSSVAGGVINIRAGSGADPRTAQVD